ncbi:MAG: RNA polymerase factor sigma-54 [Agriterribacter sp.]
MLTQSKLLKHQLTLNPRQLAQLHLYQLDQLQLLQRIAIEIEENPFLEEPVQEEEHEHAPDEAIQDYQSWEEFAEKENSGSFQTSDKASRLEYLAARVTDQQTDYRTEMKQQLSFLSIEPLAYKLGCFLIDSCDERGFLRQDIQGLVDAFGFENQKFIPEAQALEIIKHIKQLEPTGVGCTCLKEFYLLQLEKTKDERKSAALYLIEHDYEKLQQRKWKEVQRNMHSAGFELRSTLEFVSTLKTSPIDAPMLPSDYIVPDFIVSVEDDEICVSLNNARGIALNTEYRSSIEDLYQGKNSGRQMSYIRDRYQAAKWFVEVLRKREEHLLKAMHVIIDIQREFFLSGEMVSLKPMLLKNISEKINLDIPTVSRLISNKYVSTPFGTIGLKQLFSEGTAVVKGERVSGKKVESSIRRIISKENKITPYTDQELTDLLVAEGYIIARRTVTKYRERLGIPICKMREEEMQK